MEHVFLCPKCFNVSHMVFDTVKDGVNMPELLQAVYVS